MAAIENYFKENPNVVIFTNLDDIGQPRTCEQWGDRYGDFDAVPLITDDGVQDVIWGWLHTGGAFPSTAYLDHTMTVYFKANNPSFSIAVGMIEDMLDDCDELCTLSAPEALFDFEIDGNTVMFLNFSDMASEGWNLVEWAWDFGDGSTSAEENPIHTYEEDGTYTVSLTVTTDIGTESEPFIADIQIGSLDVSDINDNYNFGISKNYPNPFNPNTTISYNLISSGNVKMDVYDISGKLIDELVNQYQSEGQYEYNWSPENIASGLYYVHLYQNNQFDQMKLMYVK